MHDDLEEKRLTRFIEAATAITVLASSTSDFELKRRIRELFQATYRVCGRYAAMTGCCLSDLGLQQKLADFDRATRSETGTNVAATRG